MHCKKNWINKNFLKSTTYLAHSDALRTKNSVIQKMKYIRKYTLENSHKYFFFFKKFISTFLKHFLLFIFKRVHRHNWVNKNMIFNIVAYTSIHWTVRSFCMLTLVRANSRMIEYYSYIFTHYEFYPNPDYTIWY